MTYKCIEFTNENYLKLVLKKILEDVNKISCTFSVGSIVTNFNTYILNSSPNYRYMVCYDTALKELRGFGVKVDYSSSSYEHIKDYEFLGMDNIYPLLQECECVACGKKKSYTIQLGDRAILCRKCLDELRDSKQSKAEDS